MDSHRRVVKLYANRDVERVLLGVPRGHKHLRLAIITSRNEVLVFSEATLANIVRAYVTIKTHPVRRAVELQQFSKTDEFKEEYAKYQLLETEKKDSEVEEELLELLKEASSQG
ncbi:MAG: hypothetical protein DRJ51_09165 [Thermoprotei archaeon]|nr:MAG: hypothetical protein DRJ51_09165 [Thermoprotei archaeon]